jgi:PTH1 family peptidyl-tRNA hydrolase
MWLVAGLGNPGEDYEQTRHNIGFMVVNALADRLSISIKQKTSSCLYGRGFMEDKKIVLIKPLTYMNRSGFALLEAFSKHDGIEDILIVHDDLDLEPGVVRIRKNGSSGGHNGIQSIIECLGTRDFLRLKIGIGRPEREAAERYVLKKFRKQEKPVIEEAIARAADAVEAIVTHGVVHAQNIFHKTA